MQHGCEWLVKCGALNLVLQEERDTLVDKLLSTTEALHALEARNRESQATASQVTSRGAALVLQTVGLMDANSSCDQLARTALLTVLLPSQTALYSDCAMRHQLCHC